MKIPLTTQNFFSPLSLFHFIFYNFIYLFIYWYTIILFIKWIRIKVIFLKLFISAIKEYCTKQRISIQHPPSIGSKGRSKRALVPPTPSHIVQLRLLMFFFFRVDLGPTFVFWEETRPNWWPEILSLKMYDE